MVDELVSAESVARDFAAAQAQTEAQLERVKRVARETLREKEGLAQRVAALEREQDPSVLRFGTLQVRNAVLMQWNDRRCFLRRSGALELVGGGAAAAAPSDVRVVVKGEFYSSFLLFASSFVLLIYSFCLSVIVVSIVARHCDAGRVRRRRRRRGVAVTRAARRLARRRRGAARGGAEAAR